MKIYSSIFLLNLTILIQALPSPRVAGGELAYKDQFPYQAQLTVGSNLICSGSIIDQQWILTAAQCVINFAPDEITIVVGATDRFWGGDTYGVQTLIAHEGFRVKHGPTEIYDNDIALIRVDRDIAFNDNVRLIGLLEDPSSLIENTTVVLAGWGSNRVDEEYSRHLKYTKLDIFDNASCDGIWKKISGQGVSNGSICTIAKVGHGACQGDFGGPLIAFGVQVGIASYVWPCGTGVPDVFTRISSYSNWIRNIILN